MPQNTKAKGTVIQFIPKRYKFVPSVNDLMQYYMKSGKKLNDVTALGITLLDDHEDSATFYAPVSFIINTLSKMNEPVRIRNRVAISYAQTQNGLKVIQDIKRLPVLFERNQEHEKDKDVPAFKRMGENNSHAAKLISFNPLLPVPNNANANSTDTMVLTKKEIQATQDNKINLKRTFQKTLKESQFENKSHEMFQHASEQSQDIIDGIFHDKYLAPFDEYNHVHRDNFIPVKDQNMSTHHEHHAQRPNVSHMKL